MEFFSPATAHAASRVIDTLALSLNLVTWTLDVSNAFFHATEDEQIFVEPPLEWLETFWQENPDRDVRWRCRKILYGRRKGPRAWTTHAANCLRDLGAEQSDMAPQFFVKRGASAQQSVFMELHMDDFHVAGATTEGSVFIESLRGMFMLKVEGPHLPGCEYTHLKRRRMVFAEGVLLQPRSSLIDSVLVALGLENAKESPTPWSL